MMNPVNMIYQLDFGATMFFSVTNKPFDENNITLSKLFKSLQENGVVGKSYHVSLFSKTDINSKLSTKFQFDQPCCNNYNMTDIVQELNTSEQLPSILSYRLCWTVGHRST